MYWHETNTSMVIEADEVLRYTSDTDDDPHIAIWLEPPLQVNTGPGPFPPPTASGPFPSLTNFGTLDFVTSNQTTSFLIVFRPMPASSEGTVVHNAGSMRIEARGRGELSELAARPTIRSASRIWASSLSGPRATQGASEASTATL
ncbi:hypothetical protein [Brevundimonas denitrificans]|uniref:hypothetical protein n=1 Tax=Brevundimonas denitrificans TaxID=1443434 RepID=UPI00223BB524|nr:hypothetical protein [Brevundimonas denitrificans]